MFVPATRSRVSYSRDALGAYTPGNHWKGGILESLWAAIQLTFIYVLNSRTNLWSCQDTRLHSEEAGTTSTPRLNQLHTLLFQSVQSFSAFLTFVSTGPNLCYLVFALYLVPQPVVVHLVPLRCSLCLVHFSRVSPWYFHLLSLSCLPLVSMVEPSV